MMNGRAVRRQYVQGVGMALLYTPTKWGLHPIGAALLFKPGIWPLLLLAGALGAIAGLIRPLVVERDQCDR